MFLHGQKVWTSCAHRARWCWLAAKTDLNVSKPQRGISLFIVDMKSPGITVKPLLNYSGVHIFNEMFFDNVRVPVANLVGVENKGWYQLMQALAYERNMVGSQYYGYGKRIFDGLTEYVAKTKSKGALMSKDPTVRHRLAENAVELETLKMFAYEIAWKMGQGIMPAYEASRNKAFSDYVIEHLVATGTEILGAFSQVDQNSSLARLNGFIQSQYLLFPGMASAAGTDEIEKGIIGQFKLGLPKAY
ncbi:MAG: acyl-CoA dehydrogenase family protein [Dehalococcoidia bacterium]